MSKRTIDTPCARMSSPWDAEVFRALAQVNGALRAGGLPEKAGRILSLMQDCLCSGDGRSPETAFRSAGPFVTKRILSLLGLGGLVWRTCRAGGLTEAAVWPHGDAPATVWFSEGRLKESQI